MVVVVVVVVVVEVVARVLVLVEVPVEVLVVALAVLVVVQQAVQEGVGVGAVGRKQHQQRLRRLVLQRPPLSSSPRRRSPWAPRPAPPNGCC